MADYKDVVISGKGVSLDIKNGDTAVNTVVKTQAKLRISAGGYVSNTTAYNSTTVSNAGTAVSTFLSGGTMTLSNGGVANGVSVMRNARLSVASGGVATNVTVVSNGNVNATVYGKDGATRIAGTNARGSFFLSGGTASNFVLNANGQLTVSSGGTALDTEIRANGMLTVSNGGVATGIVQSQNGRLTTHIRGGDSKTLVSGTNEYGKFLLSGGTASGFLLYENAAQYISSGGTALHTIVSNSWAHQFVYSGGLVSATSVYNKGSMTVYGGGIARDTLVYSGGSMMAEGGGISKATIYGELLIHSATVGDEESGGTAGLNDITIASGGIMKVNEKADFGGTITLNGTVILTSTMTLKNGTALVLDLTGRDNDSSAILSDWAKIKNAAGYTLSVSAGAAPCGAYKLAGNASGFSGSVTVNSGKTTVGTLSVGENLIGKDLGYSLSVDSGNTLLLTITDPVPPTFACAPILDIRNYTATISWEPASDISGIRNYTFRLNGRDTTVTGTSYTLSDLAIGNYSYQVRATDNYGNVSEWCAEQSFCIVDVTPKNVVLTASGATWTEEEASHITGYTAELSPDGFSTAIKFAVDQTGIDFYNPGAAAYSFRVSADDDTKWSNVAKAAVSDAETGAVRFISDADGIADAFFAQSGEVWGAKYYASHVGTTGWEGGTGTMVSLKGKNRIANVFNGSADASILFLTDSGNGDALALDDMFTARPGGESKPIARFSQIGEVRAGAGNDIVDLTSTEFSASGTTVRGGDGDDVLWSGDGENMLFGDCGNDWLTGGADSDVLAGGSGDDWMHGGGGGDIFTFAGSWGNDTVEQTATGSVTLWFGDLTKNDVSVSFVDGNTVITHKENTVTVIGRKTDAVNLRFGASGYEKRFADLTAEGAFADYSSRKIFESQGTNFLIASLK